MAFVGPVTTQNLVVKLGGVKFAVEFWWKMLLTIFPAKEARKSPSKLRRKFATNFAENCANFTLEIAGAYICGTPNFLRAQLLEKYLSIIETTAHLGPLLSAGYLVGILAPNKKIFRPPHPPQNSPQTPSQPLGHPPLVGRTPPPPCDFQ